MINELCGNWLDSIQNYMLKNLKHVSGLYKLAKNKTVLKNIVREYMALQSTGYEKCDIVSSSGDFLKWDTQTYKMANIISKTIKVPKLLVLNFFIALYNLSKAGKIPYWKWNPKGYLKSKKAQKTIDTEKNFLEKFSTKTGSITKQFSKKILIPIFVLSTISYYLYNKSKGVSNG